MKLKTEFIEPREELVDIVFLVLTSITLGMSMVRSHRLFRSMKRNSNIPHFQEHQVHDDVDCEMIAHKFNGMVSDNMQNATRHRLRTRKGRKVSIAINFGVKLKRERDKGGNF